MKTNQTFAHTMRIDLLLDNKNLGGRFVSPDHDIDTLNNAEKSKTPANDFDVLMQSLYDATILTDYTGTVTNANQRALRFFGYTHNAIVARTISDLIAGADAKILATVFENTQTNRFTLLQAHCIRCDGTLFPSEISATLLKLTPEPVLCFFIRDTTLRREVEEKLRIEHDAVNNAGNGIAITNPDGRLNYANPAMYQLWHCEDVQQMNGSLIQTLFSDGDDIRQAMNIAMTDQTWIGEIKACDAKGRVFYVQTSITSCFDDEDMLTNLVFSFTDTTKRRNDEEALRRYQDHLEDLINERTADLESINRDLTGEIAVRSRVEDELRQAILKLRDHDAAKSLFVSNVSHELRTPLTALIHATENLLRGIAGTVPDSVFSYLTMMLEDCWRLDRTVSDILDLSRIEAGKLELRMEQVPFYRMVLRTAESLRSEAENMPLTFTIVPPKFFGFVGCAASKIERVIMNVISNAIKFTPAGGQIIISIDRQSREGKEGVYCRVSDSGIGIPSQYLERVTERFFRVGEQVGGTGLGLSIAREIVERHQGRIDIKSPPADRDHGTEVSIWIPTVDAQQIMIVAHDSGVSNLLSPFLQSRGYATISFNNGQHALQILRDGQHCTVVVDSTIPDMDGIEFVMHIKADTVLRNIRIFFLSEDQPSPTKSSILAGFDIPVFLKTADMNSLITCMEDAFLPHHVGVQG